VQASAYGGGDLEGGLAERDGSKRDVCGRDEPKSLPAIRFIAGP
jgi:hypothetical protein